jgi:type IV secretory pathway VirB4 component
MASVAQNSKATHDFVPIQEVRDGVVVLKDGSLRAVILVSSVNFDLKSEEEQKSILFQFQNFLNSLDFSIQIFIQSRKLDIRPYIALLQGRLKEQTNDLMKIQVQEYIEFIKKFTDASNIMSKSFFVVVSYAPATISMKSNIFTRMLGRNKTNTFDNMKFEEARSQLEERVSVIEQGLVRTGVRAARLGTEEVVELFYKMFNPGDTEKPIIQA